MAETANIRLPFIAANQTQKHVTHNEALVILDVLVQARVVEIGLTAPPGGASDGEVYIPGSPATGAWVGWDHNIVYFGDGEWRKIVPRQGWQVFDVDTDTLYRYDAVAFWQPVATASTVAEDVTFDPGGGLSATDVQAAIEELDSEKAPLASPAFIGNPTAPTPTPGDNDTSIATTGFVQAAIDAILGGVASAFDTLAELASGKQDADTDLTAVAGVSSTGLYARTGSGAAAARTITAGARIDSVANGGGVAGNPTINAAFPPGHLVGLTLAINGADAANDIDIAAGSARDATDVDNLVLAAALTKRCDAAWAVGTNQGGVDSGSGGNGWWYFWLIKRSDTGVVDVLLSASATAPTMPANYDRKRRIGAIVRTGGATLAFVQDGDRFRWKVPIGDIAATNPGTSAVSRTLSVPPGIRVLADITAGFATTGNPANNPGAVYISDLSQTDTAGGQTSAVSLMSFNAESAVMAPLSVMTTSGQVRSRLQISGAGTVLYINTHGWTDTRDRV